MPALAALLGTEWPLTQAPMAGVQGSRLAIAVSNAGGLGSLPSALLGIEAPACGAGADQGADAEAVQRQLLLPRAPCGRYRARNSLACLARALLRRVSPQRAIRRFEEMHVKACRPSSLAAFQVATPMRRTRSHTQSNRYPAQVQAP